MTSGTGGLVTVSGSTGGVAAVELPRPGTPVFLVLGDAVNFRSRLETVDGDSFTVTAPLETAGPRIACCNASAVSRC